MDWLKSLLLLIIAQYLPLPNLAFHSFILIVDPKNVTNIAACKLLSQNLSPGYPIFYNRFIQNHTTYFQIKKTISPQNDHILSVLLNIYIYN